MKLHIFFKAYLIHAFVLLIFFGIYCYLIKEFENTNNQNNPVNFYDCFTLAATIQTTVGITNIYPVSKRANIIMIIQQFLTVPTILFSVYNLL
jgi:hypothetical protein